MVKLLLKAFKEANIEISAIRYTNNWKEFLKKQAPLVSNKTENAVTQEILRNEG